jgi:HK97 family phage prohead protease
MEFKTIPTEFKAGKDEGQYEGYFSIFNNVDDGKDIILPGAFDATLAQRANRVKILYGHDWDKLVGPPPYELYEDSTGLYAKGRLTLGSFWGRETWALLKDGALNEGSFGYLVPKGGAFRKDGHRHVKTVELIELSFVPLGMNPLTHLQAVKSFLKAGARNRSGDQEMINALHDVAVELGCTNCVGAPKSSAELARHLYVEFQRNLGIINGVNL